MRKFFVTLFIISLLVHPLEAKDALINVKDWRSAYISLLYSIYTGFDNVYFINSLGEAEISSTILNKTSKHVVFEGESDYVVKNYEKFLRLHGHERVETKRFDTYWDLQFKLYDELKERVSGMIVVNSKFGYDVISVSPFAIRNNYWVVIYDTDDIIEERLMIDFLNKNSDKRVIFYGEFIRRPWRKISNKYEIIDEKSVRKNNIAIFKKVGESIDKNRSWVVLMSGNYLEVGALRQANPILLSLNSLRDILNALRSTGFDFVEVIGPENVNFGQKIRDESNKTVKVVVKIGRTFTGSSSLRGRIFTLNRFELPTINEKLVVEGVYYDKNSKNFVVLYKNTGNVEISFYVAGLSIPGVKYGALDEKLHLLYPKEYFSLSIKNVTGSPTTCEMLVPYGFELPFTKYVENETSKLRIFSVRRANLIDNTSVHIKSIKYDKLKEKIIVEVFNDGDIPAFVDVELFNFNLFGLNRTLSTKKRVRVEPGKEAEIPIYVYLDEDDLKKNGNVEVKIYYGDDEKFLINSEERKLRLVVTGIGITGLFVLISEHPMFIVILFVLLILLIIVKMRRKEQKRK